MTMEIFTCAIEVRRKPDLREKALRPGLPSPDRGLDSLVAQRITIALSC